MPEPRQSPAALRQLLAGRFPPPRPRNPGHVPTGIASLDREMGGGIPSGALTEVVSPAPGCGGQLVIAGLLGATRSARLRAALVDGTDGFDPQSHEPEVLRHLVWVRCRDASRAAQAADILVRDANLALVIVDLSGFRPAPCRALPASCWFRLQRAAEQAGSAALILTPCPVVGSARLRLALGESLRLDDLDLERGTLADQLVLELRRGPALEERQSA